MFRPLHWAIIRSQCVSEETIQCSIYIAISYNLDFIILVSIDNDQLSRYQRDLVG